MEELAIKKPRLIYRIIAKLARGLMRLLYPTKIYFKERFITDSRAVIICNHFSVMDSNPIVSRLFGKKSVVVMKSEIAETAGFVRKATQAIGCIPIKRGESDIAAVKKILYVLNVDGQVLIYPEGTRNTTDNPKAMLPFKEGPATFAVKTRAPIVPLMHYACPGPFRRNRLVIGEPFTLEEFYGRNIHDIKVAATEIMEQKMKELRVQTDELIDVYKGNEKKYLAAHSADTHASKVD